MREILAILLLMVSGFSYGYNNGSAFPFEIDGGPDSLQEFVSSRNFVFLDKLNSSIVVLYESRGSGRALLDVYIYGCTPANCSLLALRRGVVVRASKFGEPIKNKLLDGGKVLSLRTSDGVEQFRVRFSGE